MNNISKVVFYGSLALFIALGTLENALDLYYTTNKLVFPHWYALVMEYTIYLPAGLLLTALVSGYWKGVKIMCLTLCAMAVMLRTGIFVPSVWMDSGMLLLWAGFAHMLTSDKKLVFPH